MGWTLTTKSYASHSDQRSIQYFSGSSAPVSFDGTNTTVGGNSTTSGTASSLYSGFTATMTDEAGVAHSYQLDGLGRVTGADGSTYKYDALDNLIAAGSRTFAYSSLSRPTQAINLESGTTAYLFDNNGNLVAYTDGRGISRCIGTWIPASGPTSAHCDSSLGYDALNRPLKKTYSDSTPATTYVYDQDTKGTLSSVTTKDATGTVLTSTTYTHDAFGRIKGNTQTTIGQAYNPFVYSYNLADFPTSVTYPSGRVINYTPDSYNRVAGVGDASKPSNPYAQILLYAADNSITQMNLGNGLTEAVALNPRLQASVISVCSTGTCTDPMNAANLLNLQLVYTQSGSTNNNGNIWSQTITAPNLSVAQSYTYDAANYKNQLATAGEATWSQTYGYNSGNRWVSATSGYNAWPPGFSSSTSSFTPTAATNFDSNNRLNPSAGNAYDTAGNQTAIGAYQITFDAEGRLASSTISSRRTQYTYDGEGKRVMKLVCPNANPCTTTTTDVTQTNYVFDADGELAAEYTTPAPSTQTCTIGTCYLTADHLGSTRLVTDSLGNPLARYDYLPDGQEIPADGTTRTTAMMYQTNQDGFNPKFTGQTFDLETLMYFMNARYYSPPQGRFISPDPDNAGADLSDPLTFNGYAYAGNNPLAFVDPLGLGQDPVASGTLCYPDPSCGTGSGTSGSSGSANFWWSISYGGFGPFGGFGPDPLRFYGAGPTSRGAPVDDYVDQGDGPINPLKGTVLSWWVDGDSVALAARNLRESETLEGTIKSGMALALIVAISVPPGGSKAARGTVAVYQIVDRATADVLYVGITSRIPQRIAEHAVRFFGADLKVVLPNLTRTQARAVEQVLIEHYGRWWFGGRGTLYNMYNSIRPGSRLYQEVVPWGRALARSRGLIP